MRLAHGGGPSQGRGPLQDARHLRPLVSRSRHLRVMRGFRRVRVGREARVRREGSRHGTLPRTRGNAPPLTEMHEQHRMREPIGVFRESECGVDDLSVSFVQVNARSGRGRHRVAGPLRARTPYSGRGHPTPGEDSPLQALTAPGMQGPLAHLPEPACPCCRQALGEFSQMTPHEGSPTTLAP